MLCRVLDRLTDAEVDRRLDRGRGAPDALVHNVHRNRRAESERPERIGQAEVMQLGRIDAVRERAHLLERGLRVPLGGVKPLDQLPVVGQLPRGLEAYLQRHETLLRAVVEIAFETPSLALAGVDDSRARRA